MIEPARNVCSRSPEECSSGPQRSPRTDQVSLLAALMAVSRTSRTIQDLPRCKPSLSPPGHSWEGKQANVWAGPMSSVTAGPRPASTLQITAGELLQTLVSCKTAVSHAWLILPTSPAGCGHMSSPAGTFCPAPPRISSLRARGFSRRPRRSGSSEETKSRAVGLVAA